MPVFTAGVVRSRYQSKASQLIGFRGDVMYTKKAFAAAVSMVVAVLGAACQQGEASERRTDAVAQVSAGDVALAPTDGLQLVVAPEGNEVRYRVREQLAGFDLPNDAIGATSQVTGGITFDATGRIVPASSKFVVKVGTLESDKDRRDGYVRNRILETNQFPTVELTPTALQGLTLPVPTSGSKTFQVVGDLTVHGVTKPTTWQV